MHFSAEFNYQIIKHLTLTGLTPPGTGLGLVKLDGLISGMWVKQVRSKINISKHMHINVYFIHTQLLYSYYATALHVLSHGSQCGAADFVLIFLGASVCTAPKFYIFTEANLCVLSLVQCAAQHRHQTILM